MKINHIATRFNYWILIIIALSLPFFLYYYYNYTSEVTYKKNYYIIKSDDLGFIKKLDLQDNPIINDSSIKDFIENSMIGILNYRPNVAIRNLDNYEIFFSSEAFSSFKTGFEIRIESEINSGVVINEAVITRRPLYVGRYEYYDGSKSYLYYLKVRELKTGETGKEILKTSEVMLEIVQEDFSENQKGLTIKSISIY